MDSFSYQRNDNIPTVLWYNKSHGSRKVIYYFRRNCRSRILHFAIFFSRVNNDTKHKT